MKKLFAFMICGMLAALSLTGCIPSNSYKTAHFRFSPGPYWKLTEAEYDKETKTNTKLVFGGCTVYEVTGSMPLSDYTGDTFGEEFIELTGCKYPAWECIWKYDDMNGHPVRHMGVYICAEGYTLYINGTNTSGDLTQFHNGLESVLESVEMTAEPPEKPASSAGEADTEVLHVQWSADWAARAVKTQSPELAAFTVYDPPTPQDFLTAVYIHNQSEAAEAQRWIDADYALDGTETDCASFSVKHAENKTLCGLPFDDAMRKEVTMKRTGEILVYRSYYIEIEGWIYSLDLMCDSRAEAHLNELLSGIALTRPT